MVFNRGDLQLVGEDFPEVPHNREHAWQRLIETVEQRITDQQSKLEIVARQIAAFDDLPRGLLEVSAH